MHVKRTTVRDYLDGIRQVRAQSGATEHTYREPLVRFLTEAAQDLGVGSIRVHAELRLAAVGQPDLQVTHENGPAIGYGETKPPGSATDFASVLESEQIERYRRSLENLLVTDFLRFALYRTDVGQQHVTLVENPERLATAAVSQPVLVDLSNLLGSFFAASAPAAVTPEQLADALARRTTMLRDAIRALLQPTADEGEPLRRLWDFYRRTLMSDMGEDDFADTYAQTLTYSLFLSRLEAGAVRDLDAAWAAIPADIPILQSAIAPLRAAGKLPDALTVWLTDILHVLAGSPDAMVRTIGHPSAGKPDPILYFYEHFLAAYDRAARIRKGVYYTPRPLVDYLVRAANDTLKRSFGKTLGLADKDVRLLDPAVGTGTFLLAAAQTAVEEVASALGSGAISGVLEEQVLEHFYGFELLPAPYTIAHVKLALFARDHHVRFLSKRAQVFLTNTLGDPVTRAGQGLLDLFVPGLIDEAKAAERVKSDEPVLVIMGNPPWSATSHNKQPEIEKIFAAWKTVDGRPGSPPIADARIALNDDYLKFLRWAVWKIVEQPAGARHGIVAFVTNHGFINGRIHRGVRKALLDAFDEIWVFNLHGNQRLWVRGVVDEKVFPDVQQGVALTVLVRRSVESPSPAVVRYREMRGTRAEKYAAASATRLHTHEWTAVQPDGPYWSFAPATGDCRYNDWPAVPDVFPTGSSGVKTERDDVLADVLREPVEVRARCLTDAGLSLDTVAERTGLRDSRRWQLSAKRSRFAPYSPGRVVRWLYRLLDQRWLYWDTVMVGQPGERIMRHLLPRAYGYGGERRLALVVQRAGPKPTGAIATVARGIACAHVTSQWDHVYPLHVADVADEGHVVPAEPTWRENLSPLLISQLATPYGGQPTVEDVAWYVFGVLSAPNYRERFAAALAIDHPRVPFPAVQSTFDRMVRLGHELGVAHLLEAPMPDDIRFEGEGSGFVERLRYDPDAACVWVNAGQRFTGLPADAWGWGLGFRPLEHFLADRKGRRLDADQIDMFERAVHAVRESIRLAPALNTALLGVLDETLELDLNPPAEFGVTPPVPLKRTTLASGRGAGRRSTRRKK